MNDKIDNIERIKSILKTNTIMPYQASAIAYDIFMLKMKNNTSIDIELEILVKQFISSLTKWELEDILIRQVNYAIRIAESKKLLLYEEMHKLFSLCEEIYALEQIGLSLDYDLKQQYEKSLRKRFDSEKTKAKMVAEDLKEAWKKDLWCYKENIDDQ